MAEDLLGTFAKQAAEVSRVILYASDQRRLKPSEICYRLASDIAVRLHLIAEYLVSLPPYWVEPDVENLSRVLSRDLHHVFAVSAYPSPSLPQFIEVPHLHPKRADCRPADTSKRIYFLGRARKFQDVFYRSNRAGLLEIGIGQGAKTEAYLR